MNLIDIILVLVILIGISVGYSRGFLRGAIGLLTPILALLFAFRFYQYVAAFFQKQTTSIGIWNLPIAFILCYILARIVLSVLTTALLRNAHARQHVDPSDRLLGIIPGVVNGIINAAIISALLLALPLSDGLSARTRDSILVNKLIPSVEWAEAQFAPIFDKAVNHTINKLTVENESKESISLPFSTKNPRVREDLEAEMLLMVNKERRKENLDTLVADPAMQMVARDHSRDMLARSYFSHTSPEGKTLADRAHEAGVKYILAGENLALAQTLPIAHNGLMHSPGHRANILRNGFHRVGIGVLDGGRYGLMITQDFRN